MDSSQIQFVGAPCGQHGPYTFYKAFKYMDCGKMKILSLGEFFFLKILKDIPVCIGEIQLLWEEKGTNQLLASVRLYFQPRDTPNGEQYCYGEDELLAVSEKLILTLPDLCHLLVQGVKWAYGRLLQCYKDLCESDDTKTQSCIDDGVGQAFVPSNRGLLFDDVEKERKEIGSDTGDQRAPIVIMSYPQYCRYRTVLKRVESVVDIWLRNALVMALGGFSSPERGMRVMFCRDVCDYPELDDLEIRMDHLAPNMKGRPRKRKLKKDQDSDSNGYGSDQSSNTTTSSTSTVPKVKTKPILNKNGLTLTAKPEASQEEKDFLVNLYKFMDKRNSPIDRLPSLGFKQIDLYLFYKSAQELGGYEEITEKRLWKVLYDSLGGNPGNTSAATCTRRHYERLILPYETHLKKVRERQHIAKNRHTEDKALSPPPRETANGQLNNIVVGKASCIEQRVEEKKPKEKCEDAQPVVPEKDDKEATVVKEINSAVNNKKTHHIPKIADAMKEGSEVSTKVLNMEDIFAVQIQTPGTTGLVQRTTPLEIPVVRQRTQTSILTPIMQRKLCTQIHTHPVPTSTVQEPYQSRPPPVSPSAEGQPLIRTPTYSVHTPTYSSHLAQTSSTPHMSHNLLRSGSKHHQHSHRNHRYSQNTHQQQQQQCNNQPAHQHIKHSVSRSQLFSSHQDLPSSSLPHQESLPRPAHSWHSPSHHLTTEAAVPGFQPPPAISSASSHLEAAFQHPAISYSQHHLHQHHHLSSKSQSAPQPAHSNHLKQPPSFREPPPHPEVLFPRPDQVLSRIQNLHHQSSYTQDAKQQRFDSPADFSPAASSAFGILDEPLDLSVKVSNISSHRRKENRSVERKPRPSNYVSSSKSSFMQSSSSSNSKAATSSSSHSDGLNREELGQEGPQHSEVLLQSALFGAQFTALPRPAKPVDPTQGYLSFVHPAFVQALLPHPFTPPAAAPSSVNNMYSPQFSPAALQFAAFEEFRHKTFSEMAATSPTFFMGSYPNQYPQPTNESQK